MIPILFAETELDFHSNGIGVLADAVDCTVEESLNGILELALEYPSTGIHFSHLINRAVILAKPNPESGPQPFRIYRSTKVLRGTAVFYARHIAYDLAGIPSAPFSVVSAQDLPARLKESLVEECPFEFETDITAELGMIANRPVSAWARLGSDVLATYGGEYEFDGLRVRLLQKRGANRGVSIRYGKNLTDLQQDANCAECYTGVYPYWVGPDGELMELPEKVVAVPGNFDYINIMPPLDCSGQFDGKPTEEELRSFTQAYIAANNIGKPVVSWKISHVQIEQSEDYKGTALLERVALGDTVEVIFPNMEIFTSARVVSTKYKPLLDRFEYVTLGSNKATLADAIATQGAAIQAQQQSITGQSQQDVFNKLTNNGQMEGFALIDGKLYINASLITGGTIDAQKVYVINLNADNITSGTIDASQVEVINLSASNISAGSLSASRISGGTLNFSNVNAKNLSANNIVGGAITSSEVNVPSSVFVYKIRTYGGGAECYMSPGALFVANGSVGGALNADGVFHSSDSRVKEDISYTSIDQYVDFIRGLRPCTYRYVGRDKEMIGLIAQDVYAQMYKTGVTFHGYVAANPDEYRKYAALDYASFITPVISTLQYALNRIDELEKQMKGES